MLFGISEKIPENMPDNSQASEKFYFARIALVSVKCFFLWQNALLKNAAFPKSFFKESILPGARNALYILCLCVFMSLDLNS